MKKLSSTIFLTLCVSQVNAALMQYNSSNQLSRYDSQVMTYGPNGYLSSVDGVNIIHSKHSGTIELDGNMASNVFGGVRLLSNGVAQSVFTDNQNTLKTASSDSSQKSYTDPYGNPISKPTKQSYPLEINRMTFGGGYKLNNRLINFNARNYLAGIGFTSMDSLDVGNRYNFSNGNPIMKFDPSGHNAENVLNIIGGMTIGVDIGTLLLSDNQEKRDKAVLTGLKALTVGIMVGLLGRFFYEAFYLSDETENIAKESMAPNELVDSLLKDNKPPIDYIDYGVNDEPVKQLNYSLYDSLSNSSDLPLDKPLGEPLDEPLDEPLGESLDESLDESANMIQSSPKSLSYSDTIKTRNRVSFKTPIDYEKKTINSYFSEKTSGKHILRNRIVNKSLVGPDLYFSLNDNQYYNLNSRLFLPRKVKLIHGFSNSNSKYMPKTLRKIPNMGKYKTYMNSIKNKFEGVPTSIYVDKFNYDVKFKTHKIYKSSL